MMPFECHYLEDMVSTYNEFVLYVLSLEERIEKLEKKIERMKKRKPLTREDER